jgi:hypothetical protein
MGRNASVAIVAAYLLRALRLDFGEIHDEGAPTIFVSRFNSGFGGSLALPHAQPSLSRGRDEENALDVTHTRC